MKKVKNTKELFKLLGIPWEDGAALRRFQSKFKHDSNGCLMDPTASNNRIHRQFEWIDENTGNNRVTSAHRLNYMIHNNVLLDARNNELVLHKPMDIFDGAHPGGCVEPTHLYQGTYADNERDKDIDGNRLRGEDVHGSVLTETQVLEARRLRSNERMSYEELGKRFGVRPSSIGNVVKGRSWTHLNTRDYKEGEEPIEDLNQTRIDAAAEYFPGEHVDNAEELFEKLGIPWKGGRTLAKWLEVLGTDDNGCLVNVMSIRNPADPGYFSYMDVRTGNRKQIANKRLSYMLKHNVILQPDEMILHKPHSNCSPNCMDPDHLYCGDHTDIGHTRMMKGTTVTRSGEAGGNALLSDADVLEARALKKMGMTWDRLARKYLVGESTIRFAVIGRTFAHLKDAPDLPSTDDLARLRQSAEQAARAYQMQYGSNNPVKYREKDGVRTSVDAYAAGGPDVMNGQKRYVDPGMAAARSSYAEQMRSSSDDEFRAEMAVRIIDLDNAHYKMYGGPAMFNPPENCIEIKLYPTRQ